MLGPTKYSFWWTPKPVTGRRSTRAQKGTPTEATYRNVMHDKRVFRGSNYGATAILTELDPLDKAAQIRRNILRKKILARNQRNIIGTPPPILGRCHEIIQTEKFLEELFEHPTVRSTDTQTDLFLEQPPTPPPFVAGKIGIDVATSIDNEFIEQNPTNDVDEPFIERFVEACILDTTKEVEYELHKNANKRLERLQISKIEPQANEIKSEQICPCLNEQVADEVIQIVDSQEILGVIIEEIIKQREEEFKSETLNTEMTYQDAEEGSNESKTI